MTASKTLLVEGSDDQHVVWGLLKHHSFPQTFTVEEKGGIDTVLSTFPVQAKGSGVEAVGIMIDADEGAVNRWNSVKAAIERLGYVTCPDDLPAEGLVLSENGLPKIGAWIMPDNRLSGMLEDFVALLVPASDALWLHSIAAIDNIPEELKEFSPKHICKARIHTWLAWKNDPGTPMGLAINKKYLDANSVSAQGFLNWLDRLFVK